MSDELSNWYDFNREAGVWDFDKTENYVFAAHHEGGKRIGDMTWDELIQVIAVGYHEREELARAVVMLAHCEGVDASEMGLAEVVGDAEKIVERVAKGDGTI